MGNNCCAQRSETQGKVLFKRPPNNESHSEEDLNNYRINAVRNQQEMLN